MVMPTRHADHFHWLLSIVGIAAAVFWSANLRADMIESDGLAAWEVCALCHGVDGVSAVGKFPKLAGQKPKYIEYQLRLFRNGLRSNDGGQMQTISSEIAETDIAEVAQYFSGQREAEVIGDKKDSSVKRINLVGKQLFEQGRPGLPACRDCHGDPESVAPWLNAQHQAYLKKQIRDFTTGKRRSRISPMEKISTNLKNEEIEAISLYLSLSSRVRTK